MRLSITLTTLDAVIARHKTTSGQFGSQHAILCSTACVKRLTHRPK